MIEAEKLKDWTLLILRVHIGLIFIYHGYPKIIAEGGLAQTAAFFGGIGIPFPAFSAALVGIVEFFGGILLVIGAATKIISAALVVNMLVALFAVHIKNGFSVGKNGYEFVILIIAALLVVIGNGAGKLALGNRSKNKLLL